MKTKKLMLGFGLALLGTTLAHAQSGLEGVIVEKYYVSNAADATGSVGALPAGSVTYRIYADLATGYKFQALYGVPAHTLLLNTTTTFFNNEDRGATTPNGITVTNVRKNSVMIDSWFSVGAAATGKFGVMKTEDTDGSLGNTATPAMLQNNDASAGLPINGTGAEDGLITGTPEAVTFVGLSTELDVFDATSGAGSSFSTINGSIASLSGSTGPTSTNRVLIGQFTTDGVFHYELNIQIGTPGGGVEQYVASSPTGTEFSIPSLTGTLGAANILPTVGITAPTTGSSFVTGAAVAIAANAADADGTVSSVEFFVDGVSVGVDAVSPYTANYTAVTGTHSITAKATDNAGGVTTSTPVSINVGANLPPTVAISSPTGGSSFIVGDVVAINANAADADGTVASVQFFVDGVSVGTDAVSPYTANYTSVLGTHTLTAKATDNLGAITTSSTVSISVVNNTPPTVSITSPTAGSSFTAPAVVTINANAADADGTVTNVDFYSNGVLIGSDAVAPYSFAWTSVIGTTNLTAKATDNRGAVTTSSVVTIEIADPAALPYKVVTTTQTCLPSSFCIPVSAQTAVDNIIGYDVVVNYNKNKVAPNGVVTVSSALVNPSFVDVSNSIDTATGTMNISVYFNSSAPATAKFVGTGDIFCIGFDKKPAFTSVDTAVISVPSLQESYVTGVASKLVKAGNFITYKNDVYNASLKFWSDGSAIKYDAAHPNDYLITNVYGSDASCTTLSATAVQPDLSGNITYTASNGLSINIQRDILGTTTVQPVVNGADALLTRKLLINDPSFTPSIYQAIAMDVNTDGVISAGDVSQINQRAVLIIPEFRQAWNYSVGGVSDGRPSKDWLFVNSASSFPISSTFPGDDGIGFSKSRVPVLPFCLPIGVTDYTNCPSFATESFKGVLLGDVNGNYASIAHDGVLKSLSTDKVVFDLSHAVVSGNVIDIPVSVVSANTVNALDFSMQFNQSNLSYNSIVNHVSGMQALDNFNADDNTLRFTSNSLESYDITQAPVSVRFTMNNGQMTADDLNSIVGYVNGDQVGVEVIPAITTGIANINNENAVNVYPNPAKDVLNVVSTENATVQLLDVSGKLVLLQTNVIANAKQEINLENIANGIYMLKVSNNNFISMKKVVINK